MPHETKVITRAQFALRNGQYNSEIWIAFHGAGYNVTSLRLRE